MKLEYINPFIESVEKLFTTMLDSKVSRGDIGVTISSDAPYDVTALIGLGGETRGTVALSFPDSTALKMVAKMLDIDSDEVNTEVIDGVGEIVNIVAGSAKSKLVRSDGKPIDLSLPNVILGDDYTIEYPSEAVWIEVPFNSDLGPFKLRVTFEQTG
jgi:chemotaxis protein CheX